MDNSNINGEERVQACFIGGAIGDALGYQCEFTNGIKEREYTTYADDLGIFSDDTQMMLFTANALLTRQMRGAIKGITSPPAHCIYLGYRDWYATQNDLPASSMNYSWIDKVPAMRHRRAPGFTCLSALSKETDDFGTIEKPINQSKGCGCTMRVAPIGIYCDSIQEAINLAAESAAITHGHPLAIISTAFLGGLYYELFHDTNHKFTEQLHLAFEFTNQFATKHYHRQYQNDFMKIMRNAFNLSRNNQRRDIENIKAIGEGWVAEEAVAIAIYCCLRHPDDFTDAIVASVNHDGDSDSTGIITGNIMGARLGLNAIPNYYKDNIELKDLIMELASDFAKGIPENAEELPDDDPWIIKYSMHQPVGEYD